MNMKGASAALVAAVMVISTACSSGSIGLARADLPRSSAVPAEAGLAGQAANAFGIDLYRLMAEQEGNLVISPASIVLALAMARAGARGDTAAEMDAVLYEVASDANAGWLNALDQALAARSGSFPDASGQRYDLALRIANAAFGQDGLAFQQAYLEALATRFGAGVRLVDFAGQTEAARQLINGWVDERTEHRIPELLVPGILVPDTKLTLVNAIYLKAPWQTPFVAANTTDADFILLDGSIVQVPMMSNTTTLPYASGDGWQAVELPYIGEQLAMTVIVPDDLAAFEQVLDADQLAGIVAALEEHEVALAFPKFSIETKAELADVLAAMGMPTAFDPFAADFSGITTEVPLYISEVIHQANIDVDEKGTEAAAATAVVMRPGSATDHVTLRVDRPFLFALRDRQTGVVIFLGRVVDPSTG